MCDPQVRFCERCGAERPRAYSTNAPSRELSRGHVAQAAMRSMFVVIPTPGLDLLCGVIQRQEPMLVQTLQTEPGIERLDKRVVRRLARTAEVQLHFVPVRPQVQILRDELRTVVHPDRPRATIQSTLNTGLVALVYAIVSGSSHAAWRSCQRMRRFQQISVSFLATATRPACFPRRLRTRS